MGHWIQSDFERVECEFVKAFKSIPCSIISDCLGRFQSMTATISPWRRGMQLCGPAFPVQAMPSCNWGAHHALALARRGDVVVIAAGGGMTGAVWGHVMTFAAKKRGIGGVVIDGCIRDTKDHECEDFPVFCKGSCPGGSHKGWHDNVGVPVSCGGVPVLPGDLVKGDDDGVVVVPRIRVKEVLLESSKRMCMEKEWYERLEAGETTVEILGLKS